MADDRLRAQPRQPPSQPPDDARPAWMGFLGGAIVLILGIAIAVAIWHVAGDREAPLGPAELVEIESLLNELGFPPGQLDGVVDEATRNAISDFQLTAGREVDGKPSVALLDELRAARAELSGN